MKQVSIIVPIYNKEKYLKKCIDSVLSQTYPNIEVIVINDGSTDNSENIMKTYNNNIIRYYSRKNYGIGATRNFGLKKATGDYIIFLDSDDCLNDDNAIKYLVNQMENDNLDILICDYEENFNGKIIKNQLISFKPTSLEEKPDLINKINLGPSNKMFKKYLFDNYLFPENIKYEDFALILKLFDNAKSIGKLNKSLFIFNKIKDSETYVVDEKVYDIFISLDEIRNYFQNRYQSEIDYLTIKLCLLYATQQKRQKIKQERNKFIDKAYIYLNNHIPNYKNNDYFKNCSFIKKTIQKNKVLLKIYCSL